MKLHPALRALLWPASLAWAIAARVRAWLYRNGVFQQRRLDGVVISVGNLTVGGTGKTPLVLWLAERLAAEGKRVGILTRGYRLQQLTSAAGSRMADLLSDEASLLARRLDDKVPLGIGANRYAQGRLLAAKGVEWFLLDDGFQHLRLARDVDIVLIDATDPFGEGVLPAGRRREPKAALRRADLVVITRSAHAPAVEAVVHRFTKASIFYAQTELDRVFPSERSPATAGPGQWLGKRVFAFCAIGNPDAFFADLRRWGLEVVGHAAFRDHHRYSPRDAEEIERRAGDAGAEALMTTEKDEFNLAGVRFRRFPLYVCATRMRVEDADKFRQMLDVVIELKRSKVGP